MVTFQAMLDEADDLYGLPLEEFTKARDALAKRLRGEKRREDADLVKGLKRPSVAAGAINLAVRRHGADDLLAAGEELRDAHGALLDGKGDAASVREATERERAAVREFAKLALGDDASEATAEKVRATLHAAAVDEEVRERLEAGRLEREAEAGVDPMALMASAAAKKRRREGRHEGRSARQARRGARPPKEVLRPRQVHREGKARQVRRRAPPRGGGRARAVAKAEEAVAAVDEAEERAEAAREALAEAEEAARKARAVVEDLEGHERQARRAVKEAEADASAAAPRPAARSRPPTRRASPRPPRRRRPRPRAAAARAAPRCARRAPAAPRGCGRCPVAAAGGGISSP